MREYIVWIVLVDESGLPLDSGNAYGTGFRFGDRGSALYAAGHVAAQQCDRDDVHVILYPTFTDGQVDWSRGEFVKRGSYGLRPLGDPVALVESGPASIGG